MKKVLTVLMFSFMFLIGLSFMNNVQAEDDIIDLYPYDNIACLENTSACLNTKVGNSNWTFTYYGHRYHVIKDLVRYGHEMIDLNSDGWIDDNELAGIPYNAFASVFMNNTDSQIDILTANARTDITDVVHRKYAWFDETGVLSMFEDHISLYYIYNDGTTEAPDWRLASEAEVTAYEAEVTAGTITSGQPSSDGMTRYTHIRMALDAVDTDGYVVEPLGYLKWTNADVDTTTELDTTKWSTIIADDPNNLYIPAGWTVVSFGTNDRGTVNTKTRDYILTLPEAMIDETVDPMFMTYTDQPGTFAGILGLDDDPATPGVNIVVDYNGTFTLPTNITASWMNMFDDLGEVIHEVEPLDYQLDIYQGEELLETITYTWNEGTMMYDASGEQTVIDSSMFGSGYTGVYSMETPEGDMTEAEIDIVIGVMPPKFIGVENRYHDEDVFVDVLAGITADDGYGNDMTDAIEVTLPEGFNPYYPQPGTYEIELQFNHHIHFDGVESILSYSYNSVDYDRPWNPETQLNADVDINTFCNNSTNTFCAWNDLTNFRDSASSWGSVWVVIGADGKVDEIYDRYTWNYITETGTIVGDAVHFAAWQAAVTIEEGGFILGAHGSTSAAAQWRYMAYDDQMDLVIGSPDFDYDILTETSYMLTVDDLTAPIALIVNDNYKIDATDFDNVNDAILANVVAFDEFDPVDDLAIYVSDNGGLMLNTAGTYTVEVTVEDMAGNATTVEFDVEVVAVPEMYTKAEIDALFAALDTLTPAEIQALLDGQDLLTAEDVQDMIDGTSFYTEAEIDALFAALDTLTPAEIQALLDGQDLLTETEVQDMIDASLAAQVTGCGAASASIASLGIVGAFVLLGTTFVIFRKQR